MDVFTLDSLDALGMLAIRQAVPGFDTCFTSTAGQGGTSGWYKSLNRFNPDTQD